MTESVPRNAPYAVKLIHVLFPERARKYSETYQALRRLHLVRERAGRETTNPATGLPRLTDQQMQAANSADAMAQFGQIQPN